MAKEPDHRYATTVELAEAARDAITAPVAPPSATHPPRPPARPDTAPPDQRPHPAAHANSPPSRAVSATRPPTRPAASRPNPDPLTARDPTPAPSTAAGMAPQHHRDSAARHVALIAAAIVVGMPAGSKRPLRSPPPGSTTASRTDLWRSSCAAVHRPRPPLRCGGGFRRQPLRRRQRPHRVVKLAAGSGTQTSCRSLASTPRSMWRWIPPAPSTSPTSQQPGGEAGGLARLARKCCRLPASATRMVWRWMPPAPSTSPTRAPTGC